MRIETEGLRISDLDIYFPQHTVNYYSDVPNLGRILHLVLI